MSAVFYLPSLHRFSHRTVHDQQAPLATHIEVQAPPALAAAACSQAFYPPENIEVKPGRSKTTQQTTRPKRQELTKAPSIDPAPAQRRSQKAFARTSSRHTPNGGRTRPIEGPIYQSELFARLGHAVKKVAAMLVLWLTIIPGSADAAGNQEVLCKMYFVGIHWLHNLFPTNDDLAQCIKDPAGWRKAYLAKNVGSSGAFGGGGAGPSGSSGQSAAPDATALGLCLDAILETQALDDKSRLSLTESQIFLDRKTTVVDGAVELTNRRGDITAHGFHCEVEGRKVANLNIRSR